MTDAQRSCVLAVDDNEQITSLLRAWLMDICDVHTATTTAQALALAAVVPPKLAIIDIVMPRMNGFALAESLRSLPTLTRLPVIFITGSARLDSEIRALEVGASAVLYKPLDETLVRTTVVALLGKGGSAALAGSS